MIHFHGNNFAVFILSPWVLTLKKVSASLRADPNWKNYVTQPTEHRGDISLMSTQHCPNHYETCLCVFLDIHIIGISAYLLLSYRRKAK